MSKVAIFGAGSVGCYIGGRLCASGADVVLIGRPKMTDTLACHGLTLTDYRGYHVSLPPSRLCTSSDPCDAANADLVLITVKSAATQSAALALAPHLKPNATILSLQNGLQNTRVLNSHLPEHAVLAGMVPFNVAKTGPGHFHQGTEGELATAQDVAIFASLPLFAMAGLPLTLHTDMPAVQWAKLLLNLNNAINALSGLPLKTELSQRAYRQVLAAAMREALHLLEIRCQPLAQLTPMPALWLPRLLELPDAVFRLAAGRMLAIDPLARSSMWEDLEAGRPTEVDYINGEVLALAARLGQSAPINSLLVQLIHAAEAGGRRNWSGPELLNLKTAVGSRKSS